jgi:hypothetical protein
MKIIGRVLIILAVFSVVAGLMVLAVNASGDSAAPSGFDGAPPQFRSDGEGEGDFARPERNEFNPENGQIRLERGEREGRGRGLMFGMIKNVGILAVLVTLIALPRNIVKKKKRQAAASSVNEQV